MQPSRDRSTSRRTRSAALADADAEGRDRPHDRHRRSASAPRRWRTSRNSRQPASAAARSGPRASPISTTTCSSSRRNATAAGAKVHWAATADEACRIVVGICREAGARRVTRAKSMLGEEIGLPHALAEAGIERVETDLAEHIIQLAGDPPVPHRLARDAPHPRAGRPSCSRPRHRAAAAERGRPSDLVAERAARAAGEIPLRRGRHLRRQLPDRRHRRRLHRHQRGQRRADHDPAARCTSSPRASRSWCPRPRTRMAMLRLLVRSATGGELTQYTTFHCGPKRPGDARRPEAMHIVLVDNGRTRMLADHGPARDAALHPLRRLHEPLRRLSPDRRPRLRLRPIPGPMGRGAHAGARRPRRSRATCRTPAR